MVDRSFCFRTMLCRLQNYGNAVVLDVMHHESVESSHHGRKTVRLGQVARYTGEGSNDKRVVLSKANVGAIARQLVNNKI